jgi:hypothetical protein
VRAGALTYVDMTGARARREATLPASSRPHVYAAGRCVRCQMLAAWPGARYACQGTEYSAGAGERQQCRAGSGRVGARRCQKMAAPGATRCAAHGGLRITEER